MHPFSGNTGECALPNEYLNQGKEGHRMQKTGDPASVRDGGNPCKMMKGEPWVRFRQAERQPAQMGAGQKTLQQRLQDVIEVIAGITEGVQK